MKVKVQLMQVRNVVNESDRATNACKKCSE